MPPHRAVVRTRRESAHLLVAQCLAQKADTSQTANSQADVGFPGGAGGKEPSCRRRKGPKFNPRVGKIPWRRAWQPTLAFLPWTEELGGLQSKGLQRIGYHLRS